MRITNLDYSPLDVISELTCFRRIKNADTKTFFQDDRSSHDWLTEKWADKIDVVLSYFRRNGTDVCEQQHIRDHGVDVRMTFEHQDSKHSIGFQLKSNREAIADSKKGRKSESMVATLKRQAFEAQKQSGVDEWWVVLAFDRATHARKVRAINAELLGGAEDSFKIRVIDPRKAMCFLSMPDEEIDALCTLLLCRDDEVLRAALNETAAMNECTLDLLLHQFRKAWDGEYTVSGDDLVAFPSDSDFTPDDYTKAISALESRGFLDFDTHELAYKVDPTAFPALCALYFEGRVRHELKPRAAIEFVSRLVR